MKSLKIMVLMVALGALPWAQTSTPDKTAPAQSTSNTACPCCQKMADTKDAKSCCGHDMAAKDGKTMTCCAGKGGCMKDGKCMKADRKMAKACAKAGGCNHDGDKAMACCGGMQCGMHSEDEPVTK
jgi:hypothetical protein